MSNDFILKLKNNYFIDSTWNKIIIEIKLRFDSMNIFDEIIFDFQQSLVYYCSEDKIKRLCISWFMKKKIYNMTHDNNHHCDFHRIYIKIVESLYIRHLIKRLRRYIKHCKHCLKNQITRHFFYEELNFIKTMTLFFHTITIDFVIALSIFFIELNDLLIITNKFFKKLISSQTKTHKSF